MIVDENSARDVNKAAGAKFLARGLPVAVREAGEKTRTVVIQWENLEVANFLINPCYDLSRSINRFTIRKLTNSPLSHDELFADSVYQVLFSDTRPISTPSGASAINSEVSPSPA